MSEIVQGSPEWHAIRLGKVTASRVADVVAKTKTGYGASRANYMAELIAERLTGQPSDRFTNAAMEWGTAKEPEARAAYEFMTNEVVETVGFVPHPEIAMTGASPDGLVGARGMVEIKCPNTATHIETLISQSVPDKYVKQMTWQMVCTGRDWVDYCSYDPRLPGSMGLFIKRVHFDSTLANDMQAEVKRFLAELDDKVATLRRLYEIAEAA